MTHVTSSSLELSDVYDELRKKEQPVRGGGGEVEEAVNLHSDWDGSKGSPRVERSVKYMPYLVSCLFTILVFIFTRIIINSLVYCLIHLN